MIYTFLSQQLSDQMLQKIAQEMNLSDTGFILEKNSQDTYSQGQQTRNTIKLLIDIKTELVLIQHHFSQRKVFSQKLGARFKSRVFKTQNIITPNVHLADSYCVLNFKMPVIQADPKILLVPLQASYCFRKSSCFIHEMKSRSS